ncbi:MAG: filamentous hemagglutinin N-terminal domain-containing protein [Synechococcales cyanobacterium RM1_1_8]|nr:filamentous hemagglutinin N-terminal domain-containing protein [Synechococcales cyanobacterium RM1_1_8]
MSEPFHGRFSVQQTFGPATAGCPGSRWSPSHRIPPSASGAVAGSGCLGWDWDSLPRGRFNGCAWVGSSWIGSVWLWSGDGGRGDRPPVPRPGDANAGDGGHPGDCGGWSDVHYQRRQPGRRQSLPSLRPAGSECRPGGEFLANPSIETIFSQIGGGPSSIDGLLKVSGSGANLFVINPAGILLGPNARLDLSGSFVATTADRLGFGNEAWIDLLGDGFTTETVLPGS